MASDPPDGPSSSASSSELSPRNGASSPAAASTQAAGDLPTAVGSPVFRNFGSGEVLEGEAPFLLPLLKALIAACKQCATTRGTPTVVHRPQPLTLELSFSPDSKSGAWSRRT